MRTTNPYIKHLTPEDHLQHQVIMWLKYQYPKLKFHHSPDAGKRTKFEQFKYKYLGSDRGYLDITIHELKCAIELKIKPNKPTKEQREWLWYLEAIGWNTRVCYTFEEAKDFIESLIRNYSGGYKGR